MGCSERIALKNTLKYIICDMKIATLASFDFHLPGISVSIL